MGMVLLHLSPRRTIDRVQGLAVLSDERLKEIGHHFENSRRYHTDSQTILIHNGQIVIGTGAAAIADGVVVIESGKIAYAGPAVDAPKLPEKVARIDAKQSLIDRFEILQAPGLPKKLAVNVLRQN